MEQRLVKGSVSVHSARDLLEYLLVARPDASVHDKVMMQKQSFLDKYPYKEVIKEKPHINIASFLATESMEETILRWIHRICSQQKSFTVTLNNYSGFPTHTIYIRVQDHQPFKKLAALLKPIDQYVRSNGCPQTIFTSRPHLSISQMLPAQIYSKAMMAYSQEIFHESFQLNELVLLKRRHEFEESKQVTVFRFYPPDTNIQGEVA